MKKFYISKLNGMSGISKYSADFYQLILKPRGYQFIDSDLPLNEILTEVTSRDHVHLELGIFQKKEIEIFFSLIRGNYKSISATLHDAPLLKYPFYEFGNPMLNFLSKLYDRSGITRPKSSEFFKKLKSIYVLTKRGVKVLTEKYHLSNVHYLPHIIDPAELVTTGNAKKNLLYFGFIGKNKGLDYSLKLHAKLITFIPDIQFYVIGNALGKQQLYLQKLKEKYMQNVHYLGYLPEEKVQKIYQESGFAILPFKNYRFYYPFSGSILYSLKKGSLVFTKKNNAVEEIVEEGVNGFYLSGNIDKDLAKITEVMMNPNLVMSIQRQSNSFLLNNFVPEIVNRAFNE